MSADEAGQVDQFLAKLGTTRGQILEMESLGSGFTGAVYVSGSLVEGFGNPGSDIDVFVIGDHGPVGELVIHKARFSITIHFLGKRRVDFESWSEAHVADLARRLSEVHLGQEFVAEKLDVVEELFVHRIRIGLPLANPERFAALRRRFDFDLFRGYLVQQSIHRIDGAIEDLLGMLEADDRDTAIFRARDLVSLTCDAFCHQAGNTNPLPKWRLRVLRALPPSAEAESVAATFWELHFPDPTVLRRDPQALRAYAKRCMAFSHEVVDWIQR